MGKQRSKGRPTKYNQKYHDKWGNALSRLGYTDKEIAKEMEISESTLNLWKLKHESFFGALKKGKSEIDDTVENALLKNALGYQYEEISDEMIVIKSKDEDNEEQETPAVKRKIYKKHMKPDTTAQIFWLKNRRKEKWRDKQDIHLSGGVNIMEFDVPISEEELQEAKKQLSFFLKKGYDPEEDYTNEKDRR